MKRITNKYGKWSKLETRPVSNRTKSNRVRFDFFNSTLDGFFIPSFSKYFFKSCFSLRNNISILKQGNRTLVIERYIKIRLSLIVDHSVFDCSNEQFFS